MTSKQKLVAIHNTIRDGDGRFAAYLAATENSNHSAHQEIHGAIDLVYCVIEDYFNVD